jgi:hypothetical protein
MALFFEGYEELYQVIVAGDLEAAIVLLGQLDLEEEDRTVLYIGDLVRDMLELMIHRALDGEPRYMIHRARDGEPRSSAFDEDKVSVNRYLRDVEIARLADEIALHEEDRGRRPPLEEEAGWCRVLEKAWAAALRRVTLSWPGTPHTTSDLDRLLDRGSILDEARRLIEELRLP